jgi:hypothetical protein
MSANSKQVGGDHYKFKDGMQPWDLFGPEFLMGNAVKYVVRWRKKNGVADLEKAKHYAEKLIEFVKSRKPPLILNEFRGNRTGVMVESCGKNWGLDWVERSIIHSLLFFENIGNIEIAIDGIDYLIESATKIDHLIKTTVLPPAELSKTALVEKVDEATRRVPRYFKPEPYQEMVVPPVNKHPPGHDGRDLPTGGDKNESVEFNWPLALWPELVALWPEVESEK